MTDPIVQSLNSNGWSVTTTSNPPTMQPDVAPKFLYASRQGFDQTGAAKTYVEGIILTQCLRQPYPNQASLTSDQVVLSDYLYSTDTVVGSITGTSSEASPKPVANWARVDRRLVGNSFPKEWAEVVAFHRNARNNEQIACVVWTWTDGANTVTAKVGASVLSADPLDLNPVIVYRPADDVDISSLTAGQITMNAKVYPWIGDASSVLDSSGGTANSREFCPQVFTKNPTLTAAPWYGYIDDAAGVDATGAVSTNAATAGAAPFKTLSGLLVKARTTMPGNLVDGLIIRGRGTLPQQGNVTFNTYQSAAEVIFESDPLNPCTMSFGSTAAITTQLMYLRFRNITLTRTGVFAFGGKAAGAKVVYENVVMNAGNAAASLASASNTSIYIHGMSVTNLHASTLTTGTTELRLLRGVTAGTLNAATLASAANWLVLGCNLAGCKPVASSAQADSGGICAYSKWLGTGSNSGNFLTLGRNFSFTGYAFVQNIVEWTNTAAQPAFAPSADGGLYNATHLIVHHNVFLGAAGSGRGNILYDETASTYRTHKLQSFRGNIHVSINNKSDVFKSDGGHVGNWPYMYGVGCAGEFAMFADVIAGGIGSAFAQAYPGLGASIGTSTTVRNDPLFTSYQGATVTAGPTVVAGAGGGDYTLQSGSPCIGRVKAPVLAFDLAGNARSATASAAGAYERVA